MTQDDLSKAYQEPEPRLRAVTYRMLGTSSPDVDDALQNIALKAWLKYSTLQCKTYLSGWLLRIAKNECIDMLRQRKRKCECLTDDFSVFYSGSSLEDSVMDEMLIQCILEKVDSPYSDEIQLYYYYGLKIREIAIVLERPENTVKGFLYRAWKMMLKSC